VTPRQTCPQPNGIGRNLRSKTRWFTGFCNSHQVSHFATFFIDARAEISVAESRLSIGILGTVPVKAQRFVSAKISLTPIAPDFDVVREREADTTTRDATDSATRQADWIGACTLHQSARYFLTCSRVVCFAGFDNDPSAGSPTETLLRLLLPLNDKVQWTSRDVAGGEPPTSPRSEHFTGPFNR
jgi:hypothetical protein